MWLEIILLSLLILLLYRQWYSIYDYWEKKGFPHVRGTFPLGTSPNNIFSNYFQGEWTKQLYNKLDPYPLGGFYVGRRCELLLREPEYIKRILVKDFSYFRDRLDTISSSPLGKHLFNVKGDLWRALRIKLTPTFTTGKLKGMFTIFQDCANRLDEQLELIVNRNDELDVKDWMARFTTDIICTCAFGLEINSLEQPDNELRVVGQTIFKPSISIKMKLIRIILSITPSILRLVKFNVFNKRLETSLLKIITETIEYREKNNIKRNDFLDLLISIRDKDNLVNRGRTEEQNNTEDLQSNNLKMDLELITAQCFVFFAAGFETSSSVQSYCIYELTMNPDIQDKLIVEIDDTLKKYNGQVTYQALQEMTYLEQVIFETMRKYPTLSFLSRICTKEYPIPEMGVVVEKGVRITIPVFAIHRDPKYYPEPEKFDPERFSPENRSSIPPYAYLPFGEGPRICIG